MISKNYLSRGLREQVTLVFKESGRQPCSLRFLVMSLLQQGAGAARRGLFLPPEKPQLPGKITPPEISPRRCFGVFSAVKEGFIPAPPTG